jgi:DNA-3-methyladenine glycosylase II
MDYVLHLAKDKKLKRLIDQHVVTMAPFTLSKRTDVPLYLCGSIMSQQLSTKVAATIYKRFLNIYEGRSPRPEEILATPFEILRAIGLSNAKVRYVQNVARFSIEQGMDHGVLDKMDNEEVIAYLTQIKGVGRWTVEMLLMFSLGREDIFAIDDGGIQNAMIGLYKLDRTDKRAFRERLLGISQKWSPYRTFACLHLWRWKDNSPKDVGKSPVAAKKKPAVKEKGPVAAKKKPVVKGKSPVAAKKKK